MSGALLHTYETPEGAIEAFEGPTNTVVLRSAATGQAIQIARTAQDLIDCGLDPAPVLTRFGALTIEEYQALRRARAGLSEALIRRGLSHTSEVDDGEIVVRLERRDAVRLAQILEDR